MPRVMQRMYRDSMAMISGKDTGVNPNMLRIAIQGLGMQQATPTAIQQTPAAGVPKKVP